MLNAVGQGEDLVCVYRHLLCAPGQAGTVEKVAALLGRDGKEVVSLLEDLVSLGLVEPPDGELREFRAVHPRLGLGRLITEAESELSRSRETIEVARSTTDVLSAMYEESRRRDTFVRIREERLIRPRLLALLEQAVEECLVLLPRECDWLRWEDLVCSRRSWIRVAVSEGGLEHCQGGTACLHPLMAQGVDVRAAQVLPIFTLIVDSRIVVLPVDPVAPALGAVEVGNPGVVAMALELAERTWAAAASLSVGLVGQGARGLDGVETEVLRLLAAGLTDDATARKLGLSVRKVRKVIAGLMVRLGSRSRFQLGARAMRRGWL